MLHMPHYFGAKRGDGRYSTKISFFCGDAQLRGFVVLYFSRISIHLFLAQLGLLFSFLIPETALADVWKEVDANGMVQFTNQPPSNKGELVIESNPSGTLTGGRSVRVPSASSNANNSVVAIINASAAHGPVHDSLSAASEAYGVDLDLLKAVVATESAFNPKAVSPKGAVGLMQVMPTTATRYGVLAGRGATVSAKLKDPDLNIHTGARHLANLLRLFEGKIELALAAYNAGEGAVARAGNKIPEYKETQSYVQRVMSTYRLLQASLG